MQGEISDIVGVWRVRFDDASVPERMFIFHADGTLVESNSVAATHANQTTGMGVWEEHYGQVRARYEDLRAGHKDKSVIRGVMDLTLHPTPTSFTGTTVFKIFELDNSIIKDPVTGTISGDRVALENFAA